MTDCPTCGNPYIGGPGCYQGACAWTCGDPDHKAGDCTDECWNPLALTPTTHRRSQ